MRDFDLFLFSHYFEFFFFLFNCSCFTNVVGSLTMIVYLMFIHLIFRLSLMFCEFKFSLFLFIGFVLYFPYMSLWFVFSVSGIYRLILSIVAIYTSN